MQDQVKVDDIQAFSRFRVALIKFAQVVSNTLSAADNEISHTRSWLEGEQRTLWESQLRKRLEAVTNARETLRQKKLYKDASGRTPGVVEEEKALAKCLAAAEHARERIESIRRWLPKLEKAAGLYRGGVAPLAKTVNDDIPRAIALLDRLAASLEQYLQIEAPGTTAGDAAAASPDEAAMSRGGDDAPPATPVAEPPSVAAPYDAPPAAPSMEVRHVADGQ